MRTNAQKCTEKQGVQRKSWPAKPIAPFTATLTKLKDDSVLKDPAAGPDDDDELFELLLAVSDWVDHYCNRHFYPRVETLLFDGTGGDRLLAPDLISVSELAEGDSSGREFGKVWDSGDYRLLPHNAAPLRPLGPPLRRDKGARGAGRRVRFWAGQLPRDRRVGLPPVRRGVGGNPSRIGCRRRRDDNRQRWSSVPRGPDRAAGGRRQ